MEQLPTILSLLGTLVLMVLIFVGAYAASRFMGRRYQGGGRSGGMDVLARMPLGRDSTLLAVRVAGKVLLLGVTPHHIEKLDELDPAALPPERLRAERGMGETAGGETVKKQSPVKKRWGRRLAACLVWTLFVACAAGMRVHAASINLDLNGDGGTGSLQLLFLFTLLAVGPSLLIMMTSFTRIVIVFSFLRSAIGLQQTPPNQVIIGIALFLSLFIMSPTLTEVNDTGIQPYLSGAVTQSQALDNMQKPLKKFMLKQTRANDLNLFLSLSGERAEIKEINPDTLLGLKMSVVVPAFITSELKRAFTIGFLLFLPFMVIDMIVASTLMSMGMVMLPPSMISMPFKLLLFISLDGWQLLFSTLVRSFQ